MKKERVKNYTIKCINGCFYIYTWVYVPKYLRKKREKNKRFIWKNCGRFGSERANLFLKTLSKSGQDMAMYEYKQKLLSYQQLQSVIQNIEHTEPYKTIKANIMQVNNSHNRRAKLKIFNKTVKQLAQEKIKQYKHQ